MKIVITGGAGFIGSHLAERLIRDGNEVLIIDDLSSGTKENIPKEAKFVKKDIRTGIPKELTGVDTVFHFAADPDVRGSAMTPEKTFDINVAGTFKVLESCRKSGVKQIVFASTSTVYGEAKIIPTPEDYPCAPISTYGASKLAGESYIASYSGSYGIKGTSLRFANIFGERSNHGVMFDFFNKLQKNPESLEILGNGKQDKSYLHIDDCVSGIICAWKNQKSNYDSFNVGSNEKVTVDRIAKLVSSNMDLNPKLSYSGTERGWTGDVKVMLLGTKKLENFGWKAQIAFEEGVKRYIKWLKNV